MEVPDTRYAKSGGVNLAYQIFGSGPPVVIIPPLISNIELVWEQELYRRVLDYVGRHVTAIQFDKRGIGISDRFDEIPTLEQRIGDITAVMDAVGVERASLLGLSEGGLMAQLFASSHPNRVDKLVLTNSIVGNHGIWLYPKETLRTLANKFAHLTETWGRDPQYFVDWFVPSQSTNPSFVSWMGRLQRQSASPADFERQFRSVAALEAPKDLSMIAAPTLINHVLGDRVAPVEGSRALAAAIPGARLVEVAGDDHFPWMLPSWRADIDRALEFITGEVPRSKTVRRMATVLFTDLVDSTASSASVGDAVWHSTLDSHNRISAQLVNQNGGRIVKSTGDGLLAVFDDPSSAIDATCSMSKELAGIGLTIRAGIHSGQIEVHDDDDISGLAVNLAARIEHVAASGSVFTSSTVRELLLGSDYAFVDRGDFELKGIEGSWHLYSVND